MEELSSIGPAPYSLDQVEKIKGAIKLLHLSALKSIEVNGA